MGKMKEIIMNDLQKLSQERVLKLMENQKIRHEWVLALPKLITEHVEAFLDVCSDEYFTNPRVISRNRLIYDIDFCADYAWVEFDEGSPEEILIHNLCEIGRKFREVINDSDNEKHDDIFTGGFLECPHERVEKLKKRAADTIKKPLPYDAYSQVGWCHREVQRLLIASLRKQIPELKAASVYAKYYPAESDGCCGRGDTYESYSIKISLEVQGV